MKRELLLTSDGSHTVAIPELGLTYHSVHGAVQESRYVFVEAGLKHALSAFTETNTACLRIFEMGFGTGLNALLSLAQVKEESRCLYYQSVELYPLSAEEVQKLNYISILGDESLRQPFLRMHQCASDIEVAVTPFFTLHKSMKSLPGIKPAQPFHLIYFDAFAPDAQPEMWTLPVFQHMYGMLCNGGVLVTYCSKGSVRRAMQAAGFAVQKLEGPPGKREMIRAVRTTKNI